MKHGVPYPVIARVSMGVYGARFPALIRGIVAIFWYGVQTYFASTAVTLLLTALFGLNGGAEFLGMTGVGWVSYIIVCVFQVALFMKGIDWVGKFLNWAGPFVYLVMIALMLVIWWKAGNGIFGALGSIFEGGEATDARGPVAAFLAIVGTMIAYFAAVVINFGDFSRFVKDRGGDEARQLLGPAGVDRRVLVHRAFRDSGNGGSVRRKAGEPNRHHRARR